MLLRVAQTAFEEQLVLKMSPLKIFPAEEESLGLFS
jgi:hypothetical protein